MSLSRRSVGRSVATTTNTFLSSCRIAFASYCYSECNSERVFGSLSCVLFACQERTSRACVQCKTNRCQCRRCAAVPLISWYTTASAARRIASHRRRYLPYGRWYLLFKRSMQSANTPQYPGCNVCPASVCAYSSFDCGLKSQEFNRLCGDTFGVRGTRIAAYK